MKKIINLFFLLILFTSPASGEADDATKLEDVVVTGTREAEPLKETPATVNTVKGEEIKTVSPTHPSEVMSHIPGVWVNSTGGEGHMTSIRQPLTTSPVYLYLEDGIPVRSTGFFNHNALYEVNMPAADRIEVIKGTGTALYGSDAIGGTINVMTKPAPLTPEIEANPEIGGYDWYRLLLSGGNTWDDDGLRLDFNKTHSGGWRERKQYDRYSTTLRWDHLLSGNTNVKTIITYSNIDQKTSGAVGLIKSDYDLRPWYNYQTFDYRKVEAFRLSSTIEKELGENTTISAIPYFRQNRMDLLPGWGIFNIGGNNYRGSEYTTKFYPFGLMAKYRQDFEPMRSRIIIGADIDHSPGKYDEKRIIVTRDTTTLKYTSFTYDPSTANYYDYNANFTAISPYAHVELSPAEKLRLTFGVRYDDMGYDYTNNMSVTSNRPASTKKSFSHLSPKVGATYALADDISAFASYNAGFRTPSITDLFKASGTATTSVDLKPINIDSYEAGIRSKIGNMLKLDTSIYYIQKKDDIVTYQISAGNSQRLNAGKTEHKGIEVGMETLPIKDFSLGVSYSYAQHTFTEWKVSAATDYSGKEMPAAPRENLNVRLDYTSIFLKGGQMELEWVRLGSYWMNNENTEKYDGHDLFNIRVSYNMAPQWGLYAKVLNLMDNRYTNSASKSGTSAAEYEPGQPLTLFAGVTYRWGK